MKKLLFVFATIVLVAVFSTKSIAQVTETTDAGAKILTVLTISENMDFHFGTMGVLTGTGGTCVLATDGTRTQTGGVNLSSLTPLHRNAEYLVTGEPNYQYVITLPASITITHANNINTMTINSLLAKCASATSNGLIGTLHASSGEDTFKVGGTLNVSAGQYPGVYTGTFDVTVAYN